MKPLHPAKRPYITCVINITSTDSCDVLWIRLSCFLLTRYILMFCCWHCLPACVCSIHIHTYMSACIWTCTGCTNIDNVINHVWAGIQILWQRQMGWSALLPQ